MRSAPPHHPASGYTLAELLAVLLLIVILASLAAPRLDGITFRSRSRAALNQVAADLYYARALAAREGARTVLRFTRRADGSGCHAARYVIVVRGSPERVAKTTELELGAGEACLQLGTADSIVYNSRGLPASVNNRKIVVRRGESADSMVLSSVGRVWRWY